MTNDNWKQLAHPSALVKGKSRASIEILVNDDRNAIVRTYNQDGLPIFQHSTFATVELAKAYADGIKDGLIAIGKWRSA